MKLIENVEEEGSVYGMREREGHLVGGGEEASAVYLGRARFPLGPLCNNSAIIVARSHQSSYHRHDHFPGTTTLLLKFPSSRPRVILESRVASKSSKICKCISPPSLQTLRVYHQFAQAHATQKIATQRCKVSVGFMLPPLPCCMTASVHSWTSSDVPRINICLRVPLAYGNNGWVNQLAIVDGTHLVVSTSSGLHLVVASVVPLLCGSLAIGNAVEIFWHIRRIRSDAIRVA